MPNFNAQLVDGASPAQTAALAMLEDASIQNMAPATIAAADAQWWLRGSARTPTRI
jgi:hypothetical protein